MLLAWRTRDHSRARREIVISFYADGHCADDTCPSLRQAIFQAPGKAATAFSNGLRLKHGNGSGDIRHRAAVDHATNVCRCRSLLRVVVNLG